MARPTRMTSSPQNTWNPFGNIPQGLLGNRPVRETPFFVFLDEFGQHVGASGPGNPGQDAPLRNNSLHALLEALGMDAEHGVFVVDNRREPGGADVAPRRSARLRGYRGMVLR